ncbi:MAG: hypothetical protein JWM57_3965 [Phycisphaerales bacterium]|nr:hypothetical protein [Phycisphaerales bacterium]
MLFETFEARNLFAATAVLNTSTFSLNITGTGGNDTIALSVSGTNCKVVLNGSVTKYFALNKITAINAHLGGGNDKLTMASNLNKAAALFGEAGNDSLVGGGQNDYLDGGSENDLLDGAGGDDQLKGNSGTDTADFSNRTYAVTVTLDDNANDGGAGGHDNVYSDVENVKGGSAGDTIYGSSKNNKLEGNGGNDSIYGNGGNDSIYGGSGKDYLAGNTGNDVLYGGNDNDILDASDGVAGNDTVYGEGGTDDAYYDKTTTKKDTVYTSEHLHA